MPFAVGPTTVTGSHVAISTGPCLPWAETTDICHDTSDIDADVLARFLLAASEILFELSARRFPGPCTYIVRPCARPAVAAWWPQSPWSYASPMIVPSGGQLVSYGSCGCDQTERCGCHSFPSVDLGYTPIVTVDRVVVDGVELDPSAYRVDEWRHLVRLDGEGWPCFPAGTRVLTTTGLRPIEAIRPGERVLTHRNRWRTVLRSGQTGNSETVTIRGRGGTISCTPDHRFLASEVHGEPGQRKLGSPEWTSATNLVGHAWAMPSSFEPLPVTLPQRLYADEPHRLFWWTVGRWLGDGWVEPIDRRVRICAGKSEADMLHDMLGKTQWTWHRSSERTTDRFSTRDNALADWLTSQFGSGAANKTIPAWMLGAPRPIREEFLRGYMSADGYQWQSAIGATNSSVHTVGRDLAGMLKMLVASLGYAPMAYDSPQTTTHIEGRKINGQHTYRVDWSDIRPGEPYAQAWSDDSHVWGRVRSVTLNPLVVPVYDLEVEDDHSFVAEGFVVHNCCQDLLLADTEEGTWSVEVTYGASPPASGIIAAADLAWEFVNACTGGDCALPDNVQSLVRQGVSMTFDTAQLAGLITGDEIRSVRRFLKAHNPDGLRRRATVWSPRGRQRARRTGT